MPPTLRHPRTPAAHGVRAELTSDERTTLEGIRDRLTSARAGLRRVLGDDAAPSVPSALAAYARIVRQQLDDGERQTLAASRDDVDAALADVTQLLDESPDPAQARAPLNVLEIYAARNPKGAHR